MKSVPVFCVADCIGCTVMVYLLHQIHSCTSFKLQSPTYAENVAICWWWKPKKIHLSVFLFINSFNLREMQSILFFINFKINNCERMKINIHYKNTFFFIWNSHYTALNNLYYNFISISCLFIERGMDWWGNSKIGEGCQQISRRNTQQVAEDSRHGWPNHGWSELTQLLKLKFRFFHLHRNVCLKS